MLLAQTYVLSSGENTSLLVKLKKRISFKKVVYSEGASLKLRVNCGIMTVFYNTDEQL